MRPILSSPAQAHLVRKLPLTSPPHLPQHPLGTHHLETSVIGVSAVPLVRYDLIPCLAHGRLLGTGDSNTMTLSGPMPRTWHAYLSRFVSLKEQECGRQPPGWDAPHPGPLSGTSFSETGFKTRLAAARPETVESCVSSACCWELSPTALGPCLGAGQQHML